MLTGLAAGLIEDSLTTPPRLFGLHAFTKILTGYLLASLEGNVIIEKPATLGALLAAAAALESGILVLLLWLLRGEFLPPDLSAVLLRAVMTGWAAAIFAALAKLPFRQRFFRKRQTKLVKEV